jgi:predicted porin
MASSANSAINPGISHCILACLLLAGFCLCIDLPFSLASQGDYAEEPAPPTVEELLTPFSGIGKPEKPELSRFPELEKALKPLPPFFRDTRLAVNLRSYYFYRNYVNDPSAREAWALGGSVNYESGWWMNRLKIGAVAYTSQKLYGPADRDGTLLLRPGQDSFSVLGQSYARVRLFNGLESQVFRQTFNLPYVNQQDSRMVPNTFEAVSLIGTSIASTDFIVSHVTQMKTRDSSKFVPMSEVAGFNNTDKGLTMAGARYHFSKRFNIGAITEYGWDLWNTLYAESNRTWTFTEDIDFRLSGQVTHQKSVGKELAGGFSTHVYGAEAAISYKGAILTAAFSVTDHSSDILSPYGQYPGYLSLMIQDFDRADENAWLIGVSYDFSRIGLDGLSGFANYANGNTPESGPTSSPDQEELDLTVDYRIKKGFMKGFWLRLRGATLNQRGPGAEDVDEIRVVLNYDFAILQ